MNIGIKDEDFVRGKVPMTKEEIRILTLVKARIAPDAVVYDVGAGTGSISIEAARMAPQGHVYAIEKNPDGIALITMQTVAACLDYFHAHKDDYSYEAIQVQINRLERVGPYDMAKALNPIYIITAERK